MNVDPDRAPPNLAETMNDIGESGPAARRAILAEIERLLSKEGAPIVVALDGGSGAGKSTLAASIAPAFDVALIPLDDFFSGEIRDAEWDRMAVPDRRRAVLDWERLREQVMAPLLAGRIARWRAFDFESGLRADGTYGMEERPKERGPANVILIEGAYSAGPELADLVDLAILLDVSAEERYTRLHTREDLDFLTRWMERWGEVEAYYFTEIRPRETFDLIVPG